MTSPVFLSLGSNVGDRLQYVLQAVQRIRQLGTVTGCSRLYRTDPIIYTQQPEFLNCAVRLETNLSPIEMLRQVKDIENALGRRPSIAKGPREIDIDISLYGEQTVSLPDLQIPHPGVTQRDFVIQTLLDIDPLLSVDAQPLHVNSSQTYLSSACQSHPRPVFVTARKMFEFGTTRTILFGVIPTGGDIETALAHVQSGADVLDLEEGNEALLRLMRSDSRFADVPICVSVRRPEQVQALVEAGADIIRDVSGGSCATACDQMPYIYVPSSGCTPGEVAKQVQRSVTEYSFHGMIEAVIGNMATEVQNWELCRALPSLKSTLPLLVSASSTFLQTISPGDQESEELGFLAVTGIAAQAQVDCIRTTHVQHTRAYLQVADKLYRPIASTN